ncbi:MAG TPA: hypothetical protein VGM37_06645 [Armatimonadota bacterium]|jgi:hypothetical protein
MLNRLAVFAGCAGLSVSASGATNVTGSQSGTWTAAGNPYVCSAGDITVDKGRSLTIGPGVIVQFGVGGRFLVEGTLTVQGDEGSPVTFTSTAAPAAPGAWKQILLLNSAKATIAHAVVEGAGQGGVAAVQIGNATQLAGGLNATITDSVVRNVAAYGIGLATDYQATHVVRLQRNRVSSALGGIRLDSASATDDISILRNDLSGAGGPAVLTGFRSLAAFSASDANFQGNLPSDTFMLAANASMDASVTLWHDLNLQPGGVGFVAPAGVSLNVMPGVTVRFNSGQGLVVEGALAAAGTAAAPVSFTSIDASPVAGAWNGITLEAGSTASLAYTEVAFGGQQSTGCVWVHGGSLSVDHGNIHDGAQAGILYDNADAAQTLSITNSRIAATGDAGIRLESVNPADTIRLTDNTIASVGHAISLPPAALAPFSGGGDLIAGNAPDGPLWLEPSADPDSAGIPDGVRLWQKAATAQDINVPAGATVELQPGSGIQFEAGAGMDVYGTLNVSGAPGALVRLAGKAGSPGDTGGVWFHPGSQGALKSAIIRDGGAAGSPNLKVDGAAVSVDGCAILNGGGAGVSLSGAVTFALTGSVVSGNAGAGISDSATGSRTVGGSGRGNDIALNGGGAGPDFLAATAAVDSLEAQYNYWGSDTGPFNARQNPEGVGGQVSDHVNFLPFAGAEQTLPNAALQPILTPAIGLLGVDGSATSALLDHWTLEYGPGDPPALPLLPLMTSTLPVTNGRLMSWNTAGADPRYRYTIRLTVVDALGRSRQATVVTSSAAGDVNGNGRVEVGDAVLALRFVTRKATPTPLQLQLADVRPLPIPDGVVTASDAIAILKLAAGLTGKLP